MVTMDEFDVVIVGGGPGGYVCALRAAELGCRVALIEAREIGGTCLNRGCIPTKALLESAKIYETAGRSGDFGIRIKDLSYELGKIHARKDEIVGKLRSGIELLLKRRNVAVIRGFGRLVDHETVRIDAAGEEMSVRAKNIVIATGSEPAPLFNPDGEGILTSDHVLGLKEIPESMVIIGAGPTGVEFASFFSVFGTKITLVEMMDSVLPSLCGKDPKMAALMKRGLRANGIAIKTGVGISKIEIGKRVTSILSDGQTIESERVLVSVGRSLNSSGLGLEEVGVKIERGRILVDEKLKTSVPNVYAIGDVIGPPLLAHKAEREGEVVAELIGGLPALMDYNTMPSAVFSHPEFATVGLCEAEAREKGIEVRVGESRFGANGKALCEGEADGLVRVVVDSRTGEILGSQILGPGASVMISEITLAMNSGVRVHEIANTIHVHPTLSEVLMDACKEVARVSSG